MNKLYIDPSIIKLEPQQYVARTCALRRLPYLCMQPNLEIIH